MITITSFTLSRSSGFALGSDTHPRAVLVFPGTGDILFHEGTHGTLDGVAIRGISVSDFWLDRENAELLIGLNFKRGSKVEHHVIGRVEDEDSAQAWVNRVNALYENKAHSVPDADYLRKSPIVHDIKATKVHRVLPGDYLLSIEGYPAPVFKPRWQEYYVERTIFHLCQIPEIGISPEDISGVRSNEWLTPMEHRYPYLSERINYTANDFANRVTQPLELMFKRGPREGKIGIVPLAKAVDFAVVFIEGSPAAKALSLSNGAKPYNTYDNWLECLRTAKGLGGREILICTFSDTSVDYVINDSILQSKNDLVGRKTTTSSTSSLGDWLLKFQGIIACDVGIAYQIQHYVRRETGSGFGIGFSLIPYDIPVMVGEAYCVDDSLMGQLCAKAMQDCFETNCDDVLASLEETKRKVSALGMEWLAAA